MQVLSMEIKQILRRTLYNRQHSRLKEILILRENGFIAFWKLPHGMNI